MIGIPNHVATPLGNVALWLDGEPCEPDGIWQEPCFSRYAKDHPVDGNMRLSHRHEPDGRAHTLECRLTPTSDCEGFSASGERLEATQVEGGACILVIAVEYDFEDEAQGPGEYQYDYRATADGLAATVELPEDAKAQPIVFGVAWVAEASDDNKDNPWLVADPAGARNRMPKGPSAKPATDPYGDVPEGFYTQIECPWERKGDLLALFDGLEVVQHTNAEEGYGYLYDEDTAIDVANPRGGEGIWMEVGSEYTLGIGGWHAHYDAYEADYRRLKEDIAGILSGRMRFAVAFADDGGEYGGWKGSHVLREELPEGADGWDALRAMGLPREFVDAFGRRGGRVEVVSWLPERCAVLPVRPRDGSAG